MLHEADGLLITAGAGMGVDSGLPDFRGPEGFWRAYPAAKLLGLRFEELANPQWFDRDPHLAWGFYGHRPNLYRATKPHEGYELLLNWARQKEFFVFTGRNSYNSCYWPFQSLKLRNIQNLWRTDSFINLHCDASEISSMDSGRRVEDR